MKIALIGYGKMGHEIQRILLERGHRVELIIDADNRHQLTPENLALCDVAIEFTTPQTAYDNISICLEAGIPVVSGSTGWTERLPELQKQCQRLNGALFYASNFSVGVNLFFEINRRLAALMQPFDDYDVTLEEVHHTQKKDAPSGTAITLAEGILAGIDRKKRWVLGDTIVADELEIAALRRSTVAGTHTVTWESPVDSITMTHCAKSRAGFATGAVLAAEFIHGKHGLFSMKDLLGL